MFKFEVWPLQTSAETVRIFANRMEIAARAVVLYLATKAVQRLQEGGGA